MNLENTHSPQVISFMPLVTFRIPDCADISCANLQEFKICGESSFVLILLD
jgi:hypothetical protein